MLSGQSSGLLQQSFLDMMPSGPEHLQQSRYVLPSHGCLGTNALGLEATRKCKSARLTWWRSVASKSLEPVVCLHGSLNDTGTKVVCCCGLESAEQCWQEENMPDD